MNNSPDLDAFLKEIMSIQVLTMGGASAGILGQTDSASSTVNDVKKQALAFAVEYRKADRDPAKVEQLSQEVHGCIQTLQLTHTLSEERANNLRDSLQALLEAG